MIARRAARWSPSTVPVYQRLGSEFMPPLDEGTLLYMPSTLPGISIAEAQTLLQTQDRIIKQFPEVERVLGKAGRAETSDRSGAALDAGDGRSAEAARPSGGKRRRWYSSLGAASGCSRVFRRVTPDHISHGRSWSTRWTQALQLPGRLQRLDDADQERASTC